VRAYFDTSVLVTFMLQEDGWSDLTNWVVRTLPKPFVSDFGWGEFVSAIGLKVRRNELDPGEASKSVEAVANYLASWSRLRNTRRDLEEATAMITVFRLGLRFPDAIHIATAKRAGCVLVSGDRRQLEAAEYFGVDALNPYSAITESNL
jgi:uncharacterized protein